MRKVAAWLCVGIIVIWAGAFFLLKSAHDRVTAEMVSVAEQLPVPADWTVQSENVESEKLVCLNANPCPSLSRTWQADRELRVEDLRSLAESAGWDVQIDGDCQRPEGAIGRRSVCSAEATDRGYDIQLRVDSSDQGSASQLWLHLEASGG